MGVLFQEVADFQAERSFAGNNGFNISTMRFKLSGELDGGYGYLFQTNFVNTPAILDAKIYYKISPRLCIEMGLFKPPFSKEYLTGADAIDFVNRSQAVNALVAGRQIGTQAIVTTDDGFLSGTLGLFNGDKLSTNNNDNNNFMYVGRLLLLSKLLNQGAIKGQWELGVNAAFSDDHQVQIGNGALPLFDGKRTLWGVDGRLMYEDWLFSGEVDAARLIPSQTNTAKTPYGYQLTCGYMVTRKSQMLIRFESFLPDGLIPSSDLIIIGCNLWPTKATGLQLNYIVPTKDNVIKHHEVLVNAQLSF